VEARLANILVRVGPEADMAKALVRGQSDTCNSEPSDCARPPSARRAAR
jgi:hypothetical protein